jgi:hypothetical protein
VILQSRTVSNLTRQRGEETRMQVDCEIEATSGAPCFPPARGTIRTWCVAVKHMQRVCSNRNATRHLQEEHRVSAC